MSKEAEKVIRPNITLGLVHWPCWNQRGEVICTNVTNFDIHDIARAARSYGVKRYYIINKAQEQLMFVHRVLDHWRVGEGQEHNPMRKASIGMIDTAQTLEEAIGRHEKKPYVVATSARDELGCPRISFAALKEKVLHEPDQPVFLILGTGWGLHSSVYELCDAVLEPIRGRSEDDFRHLSVRSAASIMLDRLLGI